MAWQRPLPAPTDLSQAVACTWSATVEGRHRLVPDGCVDILWLDTGAMVLCGPETEAWSFSLPVGLTAVGVRLRPGVAARALRTSAAELANRRIGVDELLGTAYARTASERIGDACDRVAAITDVLRPLLLGAEPADGVERAVIAAVALARPAPSGELADEVGITPRHLHRRSLRAFGYGPSVLVRLVRLQRFLRRSESGGWRSVAELAAMSGYTDHAHLAKECRKIVGTTPTALIRSHLPTFPDTSDPYKTGGSSSGTMNP